MTAEADVGNRVALRHGYGQPLAAERGKDIDFSLDLGDGTQPC